MARPNEKLEHMRPQLEAYARRLSPVIGHEQVKQRDLYAERAGFRFPEPPLGQRWEETLEVGYLVMVHSRGCWRQGIVTSLGSKHSEPGSRWIHVALVSAPGRAITKVQARPWEVGRRSR